MKNDQFVWIIADSGTGCFINPDQIVAAGLAEDGRLVLHMSNDSRFEMRGPGSLEFLKFLTEHSIFPNGDKLPEENLQSIGETIDAIAIDAIKLEP
jgi:hypothetical protein